ncbi:hypothetical protein PIROE2DRAFT_1823 [Piromyces sp. E2]|nr:hypothetical protein PIROE2DRAFT_1823 [Piromyces sp. E2]|eukprot:OUM70137.1 hypothetical protein PIROE2DRAFT_1823 [Piromyces sp. E2]
MKLTLLVCTICVYLSTIYAKVCNSQYGLVYCDDVGVCYSRNNDLFKIKSCPKPYNIPRRHIFEHGAFCYTCPSSQCELIEHWRRIELDGYMKSNGLLLTPLGWCSEKQLTTTNNTAKKNDS